MAAGAMAIKIRDLIVTIGQIGGEINVTGGVDAAICDIIVLRNSAFSNSVNEFTPSSMACQMMVYQPSPMFHATILFSRQQYGLPSLPITSRPELTSLSQYW